MSGPANARPVAASAWEVGQHRLQQDTAVRRAGLPRKALQGPLSRLSPHKTCRGSYGSSFTSCFFLFAADLCPSVNPPKTIRCVQCCTVNEHADKAIRMSRLVTVRSGQAGHIRLGSGWDVTRRAQRSVHGRPIGSRTVFGDSSGHSRRRQRMSDRQTCALPRGSLARFGSAGSARRAARQRSVLVAAGQAEPRAGPRRPRRRGA